MMRWIFAGVLLALPASAWGQAPTPTGQYNSTPLTLSNGQTAPPQLDSAGNTNVNVKAGTVTTTPSASTPSTQAAGVVGTGGSFQPALNANPSRSACSLQNTSTHLGYVYWLATGTPTLLNSYQLPPGYTFYCGTPAGGVIQTEIQYTTGTTNDPFVVTENQ